MFTVFNELINQYKVDLVWWDFSQPKFQGDYAWGATRLMKALFDKYPKAIQNNRLYHSDNHLSEGGIKVTPIWKGDYLLQNIISLLMELMETGKHVRR